MPDYQQIYDDVIRRETNYNRAENSPGYLNCLEALRTLEAINGRALDLGCGVGFVVELLGSPALGLEAWGADISSVAVERARERLTTRTRMPAERIVQLAGQSLPFPDAHFSLVTCFDMLEHLDEADIAASLTEIGRVIRPGGRLFASVSCRPSGYNDLNGENLHRTVRGIDWWVELVKPDRADFDRPRNQLLLWKRFRPAAPPGKP
jgi:SAM-dependent methyltransferase